MEQGGSHTTALDSSGPAATRTTAARKRTVTSVRVNKLHVQHNRTNNSEASEREDEQSDCGWNKFLMFDQKHKSWRSKQFGWRMDGNHSYACKHSSACKLLNWVELTRTGLNMAAQNRHGLAADHLYWWVVTQEHLSDSVLFSTSVSVLLNHLKSLFSDFNRKI